MSGSYAESRGWQFDKTMSEAYGQLFHDQYMCDFTFNIKQADGTTRKLGAHKLVLITRSPVFDAMLSGNFSEEQEVDIVDSEVEPFFEMLKYIYSDTMNLTGNNVLQILNLGQKYMIGGISKQCAQFFKDEMPVERVCDILNHSVNLDDNSITDNCLVLAWSKMKDVCQTSGFLTMSQIALKRLLTADGCYTGDFTVADLVHAVIRWAEFRGNDDSKNNVRTYLGDCIFSIRFSDFTTEDFATIIGNTSMLTHVEMCEWFCFLANKHDEHRKRLESWGFDTSSRGICRKIKDTLTQDEIMSRIILM